MDSASNSYRSDSQGLAQKLWQTQKHAVTMALILAAAMTLRLYGLNWDGGHWLHPDERQIYFVTAGLSWPPTVARAFSPDSPLNPGFFAYGSLPFYLLKIVSTLLAPFCPALEDSDNLHLAGRPLATLFDLGTIYLTYRLACNLWGPSSVPPAKREAAQRGGLLAAALVGLTVLHIQLAHFYTVDPLLTFFVMLTLNLAADVAQGSGRHRWVALGIAAGLALATKLSAAPLLLVIIVAHYVQSTTLELQSPAAQRHIFVTTRRIITTLVAAVMVFLITQPYVLIDWRSFLDHTVAESQIAWGRLDVPYTRQYADTLPYLYSIWQTTLWGLALPLGLAAWLGLAASLRRWLRQGPWRDALLLAWAGTYLAFTGFLHTRYLRYMLPLVPILCIVAVRLLADLIQHQGSGLRRSFSTIGYWVLGVASVVYALAFLGIYATAHPWITASEWIYQEVPAGSTLAVEHWDMPLPLNLDVDRHPRRNDEYNLRTLTLYDEPDDAFKWEMLADDLAASDYLIIASRRLYGSIPRLPERYPVTTRYYRELLGERLGFELVGEFTRGPTWLNPRLPPLPEATPTLLHPDESFVVYDHPRALIFRNVGRFPVDELLRRLDVR